MKLDFITCNRKNFFLNWEKNFKYKITFIKIAFRNKYIFQSVFLFSYQSQNFGLYFYIKFSKQFEKLISSENLA